MRERAKGWPRCTASDSNEQYMRAMVEDHNKAVKLFQQEERTGHNPALKQFSQKMLPTLEEHQKMALDVSHHLSQTASK